MSALLGLLSRLLQRPPAYDLVFVVFEQGRGWILETICKEIAARFDGTYTFHYGRRGLPPARAYFFAHYSFMQICLKLNPSAWAGRRYVFYTHPREDEVNRDDLVFALSRAERVICMNSQSVEALAAQGVPRERLTAIVGGADPERWRGHERGAGCVGLSAAYYPRKNPGLVLALVRQLPHRRFLLVGKGWRDYPRFAELQALPNFSYTEARYEEYPGLYEQMDVFVSPARLEGGPIPLIEAMLCNAVPVASRTGFAPDIIRHGENGLLFDVDADPAVIAALIEQAFTVSADIRSTVLDLSWEAFARRCLQTMALPISGAQQVPQQQPPTTELKETLP